MPVCIEYTQRCLPQACPVPLVRPMRVPLGCTVTNGRRNPCASYVESLSTRHERRGASSPSAFCRVFESVLWIRVQRWGRPQCPLVCASARRRLGGGGCPGSLRHAGWLGGRRDTADARLGLLKAMETFAVSLLLPRLAGALSGCPRCLPSEKHP